jgi:hypothetical protein
LFLTTFCASCTCWHFPPFVFTDCHSNNPSCILHGMAFCHLNSQVVIPTNLCASCTRWHSAIRIHRLSFRQTFVNLLHSMAFRHSYSWVVIPTNLCASCTRWHSTICFPGFSSCLADLIKPSICQFRRVWQSTKSVQSDLKGLLFGLNWPHILFSHHFHFL